VTYPKVIFQTGQSAGHRLGYTELLEKTESIVHALADEQNDDSQSDRNETTDMKDAVVEYHIVSTSVRSHS